MGQRYARRRGALGSPLLPTQDAPTRSTATVTRADRTPRQRSWAGSAHSSARRGCESPLEARPLAPQRRSEAAGQISHSSKLDAPSSAHLLIPLAPCRKANPCGGITASRRGSFRWRSSIFDSMPCVQQLSTTPLRKANWRSCPCRTSSTQVPHDHGALVVSSDLTTCPSASNG
jgi:hypothetical protein